MKKLFILLVTCVLASGPRTQAQSASPLLELSADFWNWRAKSAPYSGDDVNRLEHPAGNRDWSRAAVEKRGRDLADFEKRWKALKPANWPVAEQVDYRLVGSALARVRWELEVNPRWQRDPNFYLEQTLTPLVEALVVPGPYDEARSREFLARIKNIPSILEQAESNLAQPPAPFATVAVQALDKIGERLRKMAAALQPETTLKGDDLQEATTKAAEALERYKAFLQDRLPSWPTKTAMGREAYVYFLRNVALMSYTPEELLAMGRQAWDRAVAFETYEKNRNRKVPPLPLATDLAGWIQQAATSELAIREYLRAHHIVTLPEGMPHYTLRAMPVYLQALQGLGELDDFTSPSRLRENCIRYVTEPSVEAGYFMRATAQDTRPLTVHEGIPGHYFQLWLSWQHNDPIRRHYYDSGANEGIGFYAEEMLLQAGLFEDSPHTREIIYNFMRLRALRVEVDVRLALGDFTLEQAAQYLRKKVPMDEETARSEAIAFSTAPGQAISYQIGKLQITRLLAEARMKQGEAFDLAAFHDFVWRNGNVPISLQRWELLGEKGDVPPLQTTGGTGLDAPGL